MNLQLLVNVIDAAIWHGGDYEQNEKELVKSIRNFLDDNGLSHIKIIFSSCSFEGLFDENTNTIYPGEICTYLTSDGFGYDLY